MDTAKALSKMAYPRREGFLIGSTSDVQPIESGDRYRIAQLLCVFPAQVPVGAFFTKRCFKSDIGFDGMVFGVGDYAIVSVNEKETVVRLQGFLSVSNQDDDIYNLFAKGVCYPFHLTDTGQPDTNFWNGFKKVKNQSLDSYIVFPIKDICRKVILYPRDDNLLTLVDFMRPRDSLKYEIIVPVYPVIGDMVLVQGEAVEDIWHGHVQSVHYTNKTVDVFFYVPRISTGNRYIRETRGRGARNTVAWESVIAIAQGFWTGQSWVEAIEH